MTRRKRTDEERRTVLSHLEYEARMLIATAQGLASGVAAGSAIGNALVESFALHARNLIDFLWPEGAKTDHVMAEDYFEDPSTWKKLRPPLSTLLKDSRIRAHKEIAHLSYDRLRVDEANKAWRFVEIATEILSAFRLFQNRLPAKYLEGGER